MGAWGFGPFENDSALDFAGDLGDLPPESVVPALAAAMRDAATSDEYLEVDDIGNALAAACLVAGRVDPSVMTDPNGKDHLETLAFEADPELRRLARAAFARAFMPHDNEWYDLWDEAEALDKVRAAHEPYLLALGPAD
ncbi:DUF4259 domain-containing protein [Yinghuangia soli]|uniref:DUF4259 domain-containing protein n=1 Tax=Yinghuangia soli TaxID=2908204 RepID=A0AA41U008_9ACTN|nr:DUF4259 domain-containing protein [Yinghuangia soli]MCF2528061.1 DUF4259 domain-containing protein [Yinghuangia soli]